MANVFTTDLLRWSGANRGLDEIYAVPLLGRFRFFRFQQMRWSQHIAESSCSCPPED